MQYDFCFLYHSKQRDRFRDGVLTCDWLNHYPQLFDADDERLLNTKHQQQYHFFEWLCAVLIFEATGYFSLMEKYTAKNHSRKREKLKEILTPKLFSWLCKNQSGQPDLFVYEPTTRDWFFCEVKGDADDIRPNQDEWENKFKGILYKEGIPPEGKMRKLHLQKIGTSKQT